MATMSLQAQDLVYRTAPLVAELKTVQAIVDGDFMKLPVIDMENSSIDITFDYLAADEPWLTYSLVHCDAQWRPDGLDVLEYADGFFPVRITDVRPSFNTFVPYYHCSVSFPNDDVTLTASGNYALLVHPEDDQDKVLAVVTFSVSEHLAFAAGRVDGNTDIDFRKSHQQLSIDLSWSQTHLPYVDPASDLHLVVLQNRRNDTRRDLTMPTRIESGRAIYEHNRELIFDAGNSYRRFEFTDVRYTSLGVEQIGYEAPYYVAQLYTDMPRSLGTYLYDRDQGGRYIVRALHTADETVEAEYFKARFMLEAPAAYNSQGIFLHGDFAYGSHSDDFRMEYDPVRGVFWKDVVLKQGAYNYQYLVGGGKTTPVEGSYYETPNEYDVYIYYRPAGSRYDRLLGVSQIFQSDKNK